MRAPRVFRLVALAAAVQLGAACDGAPAAADLPASPASVGLRSTDRECEATEARPTTGAPAEGVWLYHDAATEHRVAAIVGPPQSAAGSPLVTRRVETLEARAGGDTIRRSSDAASVHLEFVPPFTRPAAVYSLDPQVLIASYEPCGTELRTPLIRYLRLDTAGRVATDVLLQREVRP